jgi:hypothetical protein
LPPSIFGTALALLLLLLLCFLLLLLVPLSFLLLLNSLSLSMVKGEDPRVLLWTAGDGWARVDSIDER